MSANQPPRRSMPHANLDDRGLHLTLLGGFEVRIGGKAVPEAAFPRRKAISLLKLLALQPGYQLHRDQVLDSLWPELAPQSASAQLYKAVHHVRQAFETAGQDCAPDELIQMSNEILKLAAPGGVHSDVETFEQLAHRALQSRDQNQLREAAVAYPADLLPTDMYEPWVAERRDALAEQYVEVLIELGTALLEAGHLAEAAGALREALARDAAREAAHRTLMLVFARQGRRARAIRQYRICAEALQDELGAEVAAATAALYQDILDETVPALQASDVEPFQELLQLPSLVGRRPEMQSIAALFERLASGRGALLAIEGEAGIGKTRLALEIGRWGRERNWQVLFGGAHEQEGQMAYLPFIEALRRALWENPADAGLIPAELAVAIPEIPSSATPMTPSDQVAAQSALFAGVLRFLSARARAAPVILILDDLHAVDEGSLKLFHYLARQTAQLPLLLAGIWRTHEPAATPLLPQIASDLQRRHDMQRLSLKGLSATDHRSLLEQALQGGRIGQDLADELYRRSEGNALFARELARQLVADGRLVSAGEAWQLLGDLTGEMDAALQSVPRSVAALAQRRVNALSPEAARMLQFSAVAGREVSDAIVEMGLNAEGVTTSFLDAVDEALATGLIAESGRSYRFSHPLLREAIYQQMSVSRRRALHGQIASTIETLYQHDPAGAPVDALAHHHRQAGNPARAIRYLIDAAGRAKGVYDHDGALRRYREALALLDDGPIGDRASLEAEIHELLGDVYRAIGNVTESFEAYQRAIEILSSSTTEDGSTRLFTLHRKAVLGAALVNDMPTAGRHLSQAWNLLGPDDLDEARLLIAHALFDWHCMQLEQAIEHAERALDIAERIGAATETNQACEMLALSHFPLGNWEAGLSYEQRRGTTHWSPEFVVAVDAHLCLFQFRLHSSESYQQGQRFIESVTQQATTLGNLRCMAVCHFVLGYLAFLQGEPRQANEHLSSALDLHQRIGSPAAAAYTLACQINLFTATGNYDPAWRLVEQGVELAEQAAIRDHCLTQIYTAAIRNRLEAGDGTTPQLRELVEAARAHDAGSPPCALCRPDLYEALAACSLMDGKPGEAATYIEEALPLIDFAQNRPGRARLLRMQARIYAAQDNTSEAGRCLLEAAALFREAGDRYDLARTLQEWGRLGDGGSGERAGMLQEADEIMNRYRDVQISAPSV